MDSMEPYNDTMSDPNHVIEIQNASFAWATPSESKLEEKEKEKKEKTNGKKRRAYAFSREPIMASIASLCVTLKMIIFYMYMAFLTTLHNTVLDELIYISVFHTF